VASDHDARALRILLDAAVTRAEEQQGHAAALHAESRQARRQAQSVREHGNVLLDTAASIVAAIMTRRGFALSQPIAAKFGTDARGSTGIELTVNLQNHWEIPEATAAIREHFGVAAEGVDVVYVT
jgi:hypothetical protein